MIQYMNRSTVYFIIFTVYAAGIALLIHNAAQSVEKIQSVQPQHSVNGLLPSASGSSLSEALPQLIQGSHATIGEYTIRLEVADTPTERGRGLSNRSYLASGSGMLFLFDKADYYSFWMKDTLIGLDFLWINGSTVVDTTRNVPPPAAGEVLIHYTPRVRVDKVIEVNAGWIDENFGANTPVGERVQFAL